MKRLINLFIFNNFNNKAQHLAEYALIISLIIAVVIAMAVYVQRGLQGRYRDATDTLVSALRDSALDQPLQYEPYYFEFHTDSSSDSKEAYKVSLGGSTESRFDRSSTRQGTQWILPVKVEE